MPKRLSDTLGVTQKALEDNGVFNAFVYIDSKLHIDPSLLEVARIREFKGSYNVIKKYFRDLITIIKASKRENDVFWRKALKKLIFKENNSVSLGYSFNSVAGSGIGKELASRILRTAKEVIDAGVSDPELFEVIGVLEEGMGQIESVI